MEPLDPALLGDEQPCFGCNPQHPIGFRLQFARDSDSVVTHFTADERYQGPPGVMHGGLVTTLGDEIAAWTVLGMLGKFGFTAKLSAKLKKPVRIGVPIEGRGKITRNTSRVVDVHVTLQQGDVQAFAGDFTFAVLDSQAAEQLLGQPLRAAWARFAR